MLLCYLDYKAPWGKLVNCDSGVSKLKLNSDVIRMAQFTKCPHRQIIWADNHSLASDQEFSYSRMSAVSDPLHSRRGAKGNEMVKCTAIPNIIRLCIK